MSSSLCDMEILVWRKPKFAREGPLIEDHVTSWEVAVVAAIGDLPYPITSISQDSASGSKTTDPAKIRSDFRLRDSEFLFLCLKASDATEAMVTESSNQWN